MNSDGGHFVVARVGSKKQQFLCGTRPSGLRARRRRYWGRQGGTCARDVRLGNM